MAKQTSLFLTKEIINQGQIFTSSDSGVYKTVFTAGNDDSLIKSINVHSACGTFINLVFATSGANRSDLTAIYPFITVPVFAYAGSGQSAAVNVLASSGIPSLPIDSAGNRYYPLESGAQIVARYGSGILVNATAPQTLSVTVIAENY